MRHGKKFNHLGRTASHRSALLSNMACSLTVSYTHLDVYKRQNKNTPFAAQMAAENCSQVAHDAGLRRVKVYVKGPGAGRESAIRTIHNSGIEVSEIVDVTPMPHNGCRPVSYTHLDVYKRQEKEFVS